MAHSNFPTSVFQFQFSFLYSVCQLLIFIFFRFRFSRFCFSDFYWQIPTFKFLLFKHQFLRFYFSNFCFSRFCWQNPIFKFLLCQFYEETNVHFLIEFTCVISAQLTHNVLQLKEVATSQNQAKTNITQTFEFSEKIRKYALAKAIAFNCCYRQFLFRRYFIFN